MNQHLQKISDFIEQNPHVSAEGKAALLKTVKDAASAFAITEFKLERTEKVKRTTAILLEETIEELEQKRKAVEAQNRELAVETALERVRARTMAMQNSNELADASFVLDSQVRALGIPTWGCAFNIYGDTESTEWFSSENGTMPAYRTPRENFFLKFYDIGQNGADIHIEQFSDDNCKSHYDYLCTVPVMGDALRKIIEDGGAFPARQTDHIVYFKYGYLLFITLDPVPEAHDIFIRFAKIFEQTYIRFLELQKAEAQTKEAQLELSLERIRARVTAMKESSDLLDIVVSMRSEFVGLGHDAHYFWHMRWLPDIYEKAMTSGDGTRIGNVMKLPRHMHGDIKLLADWESGTTPTVVYTMDAETAVAYVDKMGALGDFEQIDHNAPGPDNIRQIGGLTFIMARTTHGEIGFSLPGENPNPPDEDITTLIRFAAVFDLAYRRFEDLKQSERQIREAKIALALERVRARTMAMHQSDELAETSLVLFRQISELGIKTWSCGFCIWNDNDLVETWMGADSGGLLPPMMIPYKQEPTHRDIYEAFVRNEPSHERLWEGDLLNEHYRFMRSIPSVRQAIEVLEKAGLELPSKQFYYVGFFKQGYLLLITTEPQDELSELSKRFAQVFDLTYTRFLDLQKAEAQTLKANQNLVEIINARKKAEETLTELRATQSQLIQSEKMASLGELTAGIAHEIQNPLNFVNNFSDVSNELIDEMNEEINKGDFEEAKAIAGDIKENLQKINQHGKRADAIVKGMLQHSRSSSGIKEPTDINKLADEYLRLAYHGLRAKDQAFNASLETDFDASIGNIDLIPQEIGRVILNLLTNAFYAVDEKAKTGMFDYVPTVSISTRKEFNKILLSVKDNGKGMPQSIVDKIFQPFFTTKPTGQGTGLGLSLAYDIVKAHDGELQINTTQGEGSEFIISIPIHLSNLS